METNERGREDRPENNNTNELHFKHPAKSTNAQDKIDINQSEHGREVSQDPADEHIEARLSQIDEGTKAIHESKMQDDPDPEGQTRDSAGYMNDETSADRDTGNRHDDGWEESRTSRHK